MGTIHHDIRPKIGLGVWETRTDANAGDHEDEVALLQAVQMQYPDLIQEQMGEYGVTNENPKISNPHKPWVEMSGDIKQNARKLMPNDANTDLPASLKNFIEDSKYGTPAERDYTRAGA
jgi:hypothetical protein